VITEDPITIGRYKVLHQLGAGAMGAVYLCQDPLLKRRVAIKIVLKTRADSEAMMARFQRESEISAQLNHPNIITVFDVGNDEEVGPFLTMEFVEGGSLAAMLAAGPLEPPTTLELLTQLGQALVAAERAGVVHRDIKPENMLISSAGQLKLTDFGLARDDVSNLTTTGTMMGTPTHTAPELLGGARATHATDRWAYAVTAFQMVLGQQPHAGETLSALLHHIDREQPIIPEGTSAPLARVFLKALHRDPARRYETILAFLTALADALDLRDSLVTKGLSLESLPPQGSGSRVSDVALKTPSETEIFDAPQAKPLGSSGTGAAAPTPRLTGPPAALLKGGADAFEPVQDPGRVQVTSSPRTNLPRSSSPRIQRRVESTDFAAIGGKLLPVLVGAAALAGFYFWPREIQVQTTPPGARILLDGQGVGLSPFSGSVSYGTHRLVASLDGYDSVATEIHSSDKHLEFNLQPFSAWVDILTEPPGALVSLGGRTLGSTPQKGMLVPDRPQPLVVSLKGYRKWSGTLGPGQKPPSPIRLKREGR
jgi:serine/threonine-protein kinase